MVHIGDFVELSSSHYEEVCVIYLLLLQCCSQILYGLRLACFKTVDGRTFCILRGLQSPLGEDITNDIDCPLLSLSNVVFATRSSSVMKAVSVVHDCSDTCQFKNKEVPRNIERKPVSTSRTEFEHDFIGNSMYCLNIYCMKQLELLFPHVFVQQHLTVLYKRSVEQQRNGNENTTGTALLELVQYR